ncbi:hypothetical protein E8L90_19415 [Brevibacillus antibioticus]|uniref:Peptidase M50 domain-containing protein n=1 Tax=Brevibacillus antibioticus TaxID=2570228 RepID=A0A4U2Y9R4_9BACL|nr:site-2 protease family protein [Brevibacillus antibioticus]TKI57448.1 hypothetical protein E8L90_19415 [Brevibacillus antibioticus]
MSSARGLSEGNIAMANNQQADISDMLSWDISLAPDIDIYEVDEEFIVYQATTKKYYKIGKFSKVILDKIHESSIIRIEEIIIFACSQQQIISSETKQLVIRFLLHMLTCQVIIRDNMLDPSNKANEHINLKSIKQIRPKPFLKLIQLRSFPQILLIFSKLIPNLSYNMWKILFIAIPMFSLCIAIITMLRYSSSFTISNIWYWLIPLMFVQIMIHEIFHAVCSLRLGGKIRSIGFGLLYYIIPVGYIDLTDNYLLGRKKRAVIALAGPMLDSLAILLTVSCIWLIPSISDILHTFLMLQFSIFIFNCNLLLPSDGLKFVENWFNVVHLRKHSFEILKHSVLRQPPPVYLSRFSLKKRRLYIMYSITATLYILFFITFVLFSYWRVFVV